jgi:hypothetical protein
MYVCMYVYIYTCVCLADDHLMVMIRIKEGLKYIFILTKCKECMYLYNSGALTFLLLPCFQLVGVTCMLLII